MLIFVNERPVEVDAGANPADAVRAFDPALAADLANGQAIVTDGVGRAADPTAPLVPGAILRVRRSARRADRGNE